MSDWTIVTNLSIAAIESGQIFESVNGSVCQDKAIGEQMLAPLLFSSLLIW
jgi:hypothetical protein